MNLLRQKLDSLNGQPHNLHVELLEQISKEIPNGISLVEEANHDLRFNCHMFSMGIHDNKEIIKLLKAGSRELMVGPGFIDALRQKQILSESQDGQLIIYYDKKVPKHSGKLLHDGRIMSKWGLDHLYTHGLWEVPASYGTTYKRFRVPEVAKVVAAFRKYAIPFIEKSA